MNIAALCRSASVIRRSGSGFTTPLERLCVQGSYSAKFSTGKTSSSSDEQDKAEAKPRYSIVTHVNDGAPADSGEDSKNQFAVVALGGTQYKVTKEDIVFAEKIKTANVGQTIELDQVLLLGSPSQTIVGRPRIDGAKVLAFVEEQTRDEKVIVFKKKRRKGYKRKAGHRREVTILRITDIISNMEGGSETGGQGKDSVETQKL